MKGDNLWRRFCCWLIGHDWDLMKRLLSTSDVRCCRCGITLKEWWEK